MKQFLHDIVAQAGKMALDYRARLGELVVERKSINELVSTADPAIETFLTTEIRRRYPGHAIFGEEHGHHSGSQYRWLIDPIDGTTCFVRGLPFFGVSVGVEKDDKLVLGAVYLPALDEFFEAQRDHGAFLNGKPINVSQHARLQESVLATSVGCIGYGPEKDNLAAITAIKPNILTLRNFGSAAMHCCYVACGRLEGYWQPSARPYDVAAGLLIVHEARGRFSDFNGRLQNHYHQVVASNGLIHDDMVDILKKTL